MITVTDTLLLDLVYEKLDSTVKFIHSTHTYGLGAHRQDAGTAAIAQAQYQSVRGLVEIRIVDI